EVQRGAGAGPAGGGQGGGDLRLTPAMWFRAFVSWGALCDGWGAHSHPARRPQFARAPTRSTLGVMQRRCLDMKRHVQGHQVAPGVVDALWAVSLRQLGRVAPRVLACLLLGAVGGLVGGFVGQLLFGWKSRAGLLVLGWALTGLLVGVALGTFDLLGSWVRRE